MTNTPTADAVLLPCPFCGAPAEHDSQRWNGIQPATGSWNIGHAIYCTECPLPDVGGTLLFDTEECARTHWNTRAALATPAPQPERRSVPGVDASVMAYVDLTNEDKQKNPEWLWHEHDGGHVTFGRWPKLAGQVLYIRADLVAAPQPDALDARTVVTSIMYPLVNGNRYPIEFTGSEYAVRCATSVAFENVPDGKWCLEVLNRYGHLVPHPADTLNAGDAA